MLKLILLILLMTQFNLSFAYNGSEGGGGGSGNEAEIFGMKEEYRQIISKIGQFFLRNRSLEKEFKELDFTLLKNVVPLVKLEVVKEVLVDKNNVSNRTCLNFWDLNKIVCNFSKLKKIEKRPVAKFVLMYHEILGLLQIEETSPENPQIIDGYQFSKKLAPYVTKTANYNLSIPAAKVVKSKDHSNSIVNRCIDVKIDIKGHKIRSWNDPRPILKIDNKNQKIDVNSKNKNIVTYKYRKCLTLKKYEEVKIAWGFLSSKKKFKSWSLEARINGRFVGKRDGNFVKNKAYYGVFLNNEFISENISKSRKEVCELDETKVVFKGEYLNSVSIASYGRITIAADIDINGKYLCLKSGYYRIYFLPKKSGNLEWHIDGGKWMPMNESGYLYQDINYPNRTNTEDFRVD